MSGLVGFFRALVGENESEKVDEYRTSLSSCAAVPEEEEQQQHAEHGQENEEQMEEQQVETVDGVVIKQEEEEDDVFERAGWSTAREWRQRNFIEMERFMMQRLTKPQQIPRQMTPRRASPQSNSLEEDDDGLRTQESSHSLPPDTQFTESLNDTLDTLETQPPTDTGDLLTNRKEDGSSTLCATCIDELSLSVKTFHLPLGVVRMVWNLRKTNRIHKYEQFTDPNATRTRTNPSPTYKHFQDDGPVACFYKRVLSLDILEVSSTPATTNDEPTATKLRIFFYDEYARKISRLLKQQTSTRDKPHQMLLSLANIPALCILPYHKSNKLLHQTQHGSMSNYCICIGNESRLQLFLPGSSNDDANIQSSPHRSTNQTITFDNDQFQIRAFVSATTNARHQQQQQDANSPLQQIIIDSHTVTEPQWVYDDNDDSHTTNNESYQMACQYVEKLSQKQQKKKESKKRKLQEVSHANEENDMKQTAASTTATATTATLQQKSTNHTRDTSQSPQRTPQRVANNSNKRPRFSLTYHKLADLRPLFDTIKAKKQRIQSGEIPFQNIKDEINIYGVVLGFTPPCLTMRFDWSMNITLIDETLASAVAGSDNVPCNTISLQIFQKEKNKLPKIGMAGDVLRAHRVVVQEYNGEIQLLGRQSSSYVVMRPKSTAAMTTSFNQTPSFSSDTWNVLPTASKSFTFSQFDGASASDLWHWAKNHLVSQPTIKTSLRFTISQMGGQRGDNNTDTGRHQQQQQYTTVNGDMTVFVTAIIPVPSGQHGRNNASPVGFLRVWDGTGPPRSDPLPCNLDTKDPPSEVLTAIADILKVEKIAGNQNTPGSSGKNQEESTEAPGQVVDIPPPPKCLCGRVINVAVWEGTHWDLVVGENNKKFFGVGKPVRLRNVSDGRLPSGLRCLMVHAKSSMTPLPERTFEVISLLKEHHSRIAKGDPYNPNSAVLPLHVGDACDGSDDDNESKDASKALQNHTTESDEFSNESSLQRSRNRTLTSLAGCLTGPVPASFTSRFRIDRTYPLFDAKSSGGMKALCVQDEADDKLQFQFAFHLNDRDAELDAIVSNDVAETLFGITATEACSDCSGDMSSTNTGAKLSRKGIQKIMKIMKSECEGTIRSICVDGAKYFILDSLVMDERTNTNNQDDAVDI